MNEPKKVTKKAAKQENTNEFENESEPKIKSAQENKLAQENETELKNEFGQENKQENKLAQESEFEPENKLEKTNSLEEIFARTDVNISQAERIVSGVAAGGLIAYGLKRRDALGAGLAIAGGLLGLRGATGHCQVYEAAGINTADKSSARPTRIHVQKSVTINQPASELYAFWRNFENLPKFMNHLESVSITGEKTSHWKAKAPLGYAVEWDAELTSDVANEKIGWKSAEISDVPNSGTVEFLPTADRGTEVRVTITYEPPAGKIGSLVAKLFGEEPTQQITDDLRRFKRLMETGLIINVEGQPSGRAAETSKTQTAVA